MDLGTGLALLGGKDTLNKLLGPTADYLGSGIKNYTQKGVENISRVFRIAADRIGHRINNPGAVPPKVLKTILDESYFCEDELTAEYLGGLLAGSRSEAERDDRSVTYIKLISHLSTYQLRSHYLFYSSFKQMFDGFDINLGDNRTRSTCRIFVPEIAHQESMDYSPNENPTAIYQHVLNGLHRNDLLKFICGGSPAYIKPHLPDTISVDEAGFIIEPTLMGIELYLYAHGLPDPIAVHFLKTVIPSIQPKELCFLNNVKPLLPNLGKLMGAAKLLNAVQNRPSFKN